LYSCIELTHCNLEFYIMNLGAYQCIDMFLMFPFKNEKKRTPPISIKKKIPHVLCRTVEIICVINSITWAIASGRSGRNIISATFLGRDNTNIINYALAWSEWHLKIQIVGNMNINYWEHETVVPYLHFAEAATYIACIACLALHGWYVSSHLNCIFLFACKTDRTVF
jgi:predicted signal transduction protein with EAL and GGDEF domain